MIDKISVEIVPHDGKFKTADKLINEIDAERPNDHFEFFVKDVFKSDEKTVQIGDNSSFNNVQIHSNFQKSDSDNQR